MSVFFFPQKIIGKKVLIKPNCEQSACIIILWVDELEVFEKNGQKKISKVQQQQQQQK